MNKLKNALFIISFWILYIIIRSTARIAKSFPAPKIKRNSILYLENFPIENSGYQHRSYKWKKYLEDKGWNVEIVTIFESREKFDKYFRHAIHRRILLYSIIKRFGQILWSRNYDLVIVRRELLLFNDYGNLFMEKFLLSLHPNAILDFDDDLRAPKREPREVNSVFGKLLKEDGSKFTNSIKLYHHFIIGTKYLQSVVDQIRKNRGDVDYDFVIIPTCIDYPISDVKRKHKSHPPITFGWIGGDYNIVQLQEVIPALEELNIEIPLRLLVVSGSKKPISKSLKIDQVKWQLETEKDLIKNFDIGLMPLEDTTESRGKCAFKLLQYGALGVPAVASAITINNDIITHGMSGFLVRGHDSWKTVLKEAVSKLDSFDTIADEARKVIDAGFTFEANIGAYSNYLKSVQSLKQDKIS